MVTKEQAINCSNFLQIGRYPASFKDGLCNMDKKISNNNAVVAGIKLDEPVRWRANGKCKTWKRDTARFQLPIKHGLYNYAYITNENAHLFIVDET